MKNAALSIKDLSFKYYIRENNAITDISLDLYEGEIMLLAGASGCGKTTIMRCINGLIPNTYTGTIKGDISIFGESVSSFSMAELSQTVGTILQNPELQIVSSVVRNEIAFGLENLAVSNEEMESRVEEVASRLGILHLLDRETFSLSGGEKQKVALAGVLVMEPRILLLDEPLAALDSASGQEALEMLRQLANEGIAVLLVEHRVDDVLEIKPDKAVFMEEGEIKYQGDCDGFMDFADYKTIKLPAESIIQRAKHDPLPEYNCAVGSVGEDKIGTELLKFANVNFSYDKGKNMVLKDINLDIRKGDVIALLGPNGAGKTTLIKQTLGLLNPDNGVVYLEGTDTNDLAISQAAKTVGYVFQDPGQMLFAETVRDELTFGPKNLKQEPEEIEGNVDWALQTVHLSEYVDDSPLSLSFGQQKRVSIASILSMRSRILLMDEPTAGQDYWNYRSFMDSIMQMPGFDAVVFITHDLDLALVYANRIILIKDGEIMADGSPYDALQDRDLLVKCRIKPTSLLDMNLQYYPETNQFMSGQQLAHIVG
jgi:energy-coupling factor transport system ATP-binding protein